MLERIDRVLITAQNGAAVANRWCTLFEGVVDRTDTVPALAAKRTVVSIGDAEVEVLEPTGSGPAADHLATGRGGPFAAGLATRDYDGLRESLAGRGVDLGDQLYLDGTALGIPGLSVVVSPYVERPRVGLLQNLYEVTHLTGDASASSHAIAEAFALDSDAFVPIRSDQYGYDGTLTLFSSDALHRIETIDPFDTSKTMGRFFDRFGPSLYMCYGETDRLADLRERLKELAPDGWTGSDDNPDGLFVHPKALGGVMVGVSRTTYAWTWSGYPERVLPAEPARTCVRAHS